MPGAERWAGDMVGTSHRSIRILPRLFAFVVLAAACQTAAPSRTPASSTDARSPTAPAPAAARTFPLDQALAESHEAACQAENDKVLYGDPGSGGGQAPTPPVRDGGAVPSGWRTMIDRLPRIAVGQANGIPVHVWADDARYVVCFPVGEQVNLTDGEFGPRGLGRVVPLGGVDYHGASNVTVWFGTAEPTVAWVGVTIPDVGVVEAPVVDGWFVVAWSTDLSIDSSSIEWIPYDHCGKQILDVDFAGEGTPCPQPA